MEEKKFFRLLRQSNEMEKDPETPILIAAGIPCSEPEESDIFLADQMTADRYILLDSIRTIEDNFHFSEREEYINLAKDFLADQMNLNQSAAFYYHTANDFSGAFIGTYKGIDEEVAQMIKDESLELVNFLKPQPLVLDIELGDLLLKTYGTCDSFGHVIFDEKELKDCAQTLLLKLQ